MHICLNDLSHLNSSDLNEKITKPTGISFYVEIRFRVHSHKVIYTVPSTFDSSMAHFLGPGTIWLLMHEHTHVYLNMDMIT